MPPLPERFTLNAPAVPIFTSDLPWMAKLARRATTPFRPRWKKRLFKKPTRKLFDAFHDGLGLNPDIDVFCTVDGVRRSFMCPLRRIHFKNAWGLYGAVYEPDVSGALHHFVRPTDVFYDVGANWGYFSVRVAARRGFRGKIHTFEPMPGTAADVRMVVERLGLGDRVTVHETAVGDTAGTVRFGTHDARHTGVARIVADAAAVQHTVPITPLQALDIEPPDVMKVDVEGHEAAAFRGAERLLTTHRPVIVFENWITDDWRGPLDLLSGWDYAIYAIRVDGADTAPTCARIGVEDRPSLGQQLNLLAIHPDRADRITAADG
jgi:FkbM family methyltransferase